LLLIPYIGTQILSEYYWKRASVQALYDGFSMAQPSYKKAARWLSGRGSFLFNYGAEACIAGDTELAITQLEAAAQRLASNQLYVYLGDAYLKSGKMQSSPTCLQLPWCLQRFIPSTG
jgi:Tfp pilus assembly protein PilF